MIVVTGATGNIGRELLRQLSVDGYGTGVRALTRDAARAAAALPDGVEVAEGDLGRSESLKSALRGARSLFLISGVGDARVLDAARDAGVEHVVLVSSITVMTHPHLGPARANLAVEHAAAGERDGVDRPAAHAVRFQHPLVGAVRARRIRGARAVRGRRSADRPPRRHRLGGPCGADRAGPPGADLPAHRAEADQPAAAGRMSWGGRWAGRWPASRSRGRRRTRRWPR